MTAPGGWAPGFDSSGQAFDANGVASLGDTGREVAAGVARL